MFSDQDDFAKHIVLINQMNSSELIDFEMNNNYKSYGLFCDDLYSYISKDSLNPDLVIQNTDTKFGSCVHIVKPFFSPILMDVASIHYAGYDVYGDTPSTPAVTFSKYTNNL